MKRFKLKCKDVLFKKKDDLVGKMFKAGAQTFFIVSRVEGKDIYFQLVDGITEELIEGGETKFVDPEKALLAFNNGTYIYLPNGLES